MKTRLCQWFESSETRARYSTWCCIRIAETHADAIQKTEIDMSFCSSYQSNHSIGLANLLPFVFCNFGFPRTRNQSIPSVSLRWLPLLNWLVVWVTRLMLDRAERYDSFLDQSDDWNTELTSTMPRETKRNHWNHAWSRRRCQRWRATLRNTGEE